MIIQSMVFRPYRKQATVLEVDLKLAKHGAVIRKRLRVPNSATSQAALAAVRDGGQPLARSQAVRWAHERAAKIWREHNPAPKPSPVRKGEVPTFAQFAERDFMVTYLDSKRAKPATRKGYRTRLDVHLIPRLGHLRLDQIGPTEIAEIQAIPLKESSVNRILISLQTVLTWAQRLGHLDTVPTIEKLRERSTKIDEDSWWQQEELDRLIKAAESMPTQALVLLLLTVDAGLRAGEIAVLRWEDVDLKACSLVVRQTLSDGEIVEPKGNRARQVELSSRLVTALKLHRHLASEFVLYTVHGKGARGRGYKSQGKNWRRRDVRPTKIVHHTTSVIGDRIRKICKAAGVRLRGPHTGRHTCGARLAELGFSSYQIMKYLGHANEDTARIYMRCTRRKLREMASALG